MRRNLLPWFAVHRRDLPWRSKRTPYRVLVSEFMLQQTRVNTVLDYYPRFLRRFPSARALAAADLSDVLKQWEGLGYYARARNLHRAAKEIVLSRKGRFPVSAADWATLPGVGSYTAAALASLICGEDEAVLDGNAIRVLSRLTALPFRADTAAARNGLRALARALLPEGRAGAYNEAMMELGALICLPRGPHCSACPMRAVCEARKTGDPGAWPRRRPAAKLPERTVGAAVIFNRRGEILLARRREEGLLGGLWEFPGGKREPGETSRECIRRELIEEMGIELDVGERLATIRHAYSHFRIRLHAHRARIVKGRPRCLHCADFAWARPSQFDRYAFSRANQMVIERVFG